MDRPLKNFCNNGMKKTNDYDLVAKRLCSASAWSGAEVRLWLREGGAVIP